MPLANPQSIDVGSSSYSLRRISESNGSALYQYQEEGLVINMAVRHTYEKRKADGSRIVRHNVELTRTTFTPEYKPVVTSTYFVLRRLEGSDLTNASDLLAALGTLASDYASDIVDMDVGP